MLTSTNITPPNINLEAFVELPSTIEALMGITGDDELGAVIAFIDFAHDRDLIKALPEKAHPIRFFNRLMTSFESKLKAIRAREQVLLQAKNDYLELRRDDNEKRMVAILPTVNEYENPWKLAHFDGRGAMCHETFTTREKAIQAAIQAGFTILAEGMLDALSETEEWKKGTIMTEMLYQGLEPVSEIKKAEQGEGSKLGYELLSVITEMKMAA